MRKIIALIILFPIMICYTTAEDFISPQGCSASTGPNVSKTVLEHPECRYQLVVSKWSDIETTPGAFNFTSLKEKINLVKAYKKKYSLAIAMGGPGSPEWLINSMNVSYLDYKFRGTTPNKLPLWWDTTLQNRIKIMVDAIGYEFSNDTSLVLVYISQMTANGNEGHLQGVNMDSMRTKGYSSEKWIKSAIQTAKYFADAFPTKSLAFEIHDVENSSHIPIAIISELYNDSYYNNRIGVAMWWLSGKTSYQESLIDFINTFQGKKYAQIIAHSGQPEKFEDSTITRSFEQAKELNIRYIEPWYEEYKNRTIDSLLHDFNCWVDSCNYQTGIEYYKSQYHDILLSPNPASEYIEISAFINPRVNPWVDNSIGSDIKIYNTYCECVMTVETKNFSSLQRIDISHLPVGLYFIQIGNYTEKFVVVR